MDEKQNIKYLEAAISAWLMYEEMDEFRWIREEERSIDDHFCTCLIVDGSAGDYFFWEGNGFEEVSRISELFGYFPEAINSFDIGFYRLDRSVGKLPD